MPPLYHPPANAQSEVGTYPSVVDIQGRITIPAPIRKRLRIKPGDRLSWESQPDGAVHVKVALKPRDVSQQAAGRFIRSKYSLASMLSECDSSAAPPADMMLWEDAVAVGREILPNLAPKTPPRAGPTRQANFQRGRK